MKWGKQTMKTLFNTALLKEQLKRFWIISLLYFVGYLLCVILPMDSFNIVKLVSFENPYIIISTMILPFILVVSMFSYLFQQKSITAFNFYPVTKNQIICTNALVSFILMIIPLLVSSVIILIATFNIQQYDFFTSTKYSAVLNLGIFMAKIIISFIYFYAFYLFVIFLVGNVISFILMCVTVSVFPLAICLLILLIGDTFLYGVAFHNVNPYLINILCFINPLIIFLQGTYSIKYPYLYYITWCVVFALSIGLTFYLSKMRKNEYAGEGIVFNYVKKLVVFFLSVIGMVIIASIFHILFENQFANYIGMIVGFTLAYFISSMVIDQTFILRRDHLRGLLKSISVAAIAYIVIIIITTFDLLGISSYTPKADEVYGVYMPYNATYDLSEKNLNNKLITDKKIIEDGLNIHKKIIDSKKDHKNIQNSPLKFQSVYIKLNNGKTIYREIILPMSFYGNQEVLDYFSNENVILSEYDLYKIRDDIELIDIYYDYENIKIQNQQEIYEFLDILKNDIKVSTLEDIKLSIDEGYQESLPRTKDNKRLEIHIAYRENPSNNTSYFYNYSHIYEGKIMYQNTRNFLDTYKASEDDYTEVN